MAGGGRRSATLGVLASVAMATALVLTSLAPVSAGETGAPPEPGSTFTASNRRATVDLVVAGADEDGIVQLLATVSVSCAAGENPPDIDGEPMSGPIDDDGTFDIEEKVFGDFDGAAYDGPVRLRGSFTDTGLDVTIQYELVETDDEDKVLDECEVGPVPLRVAQGSTDGSDDGVAVDAVIPVVKQSDPHDLGVTATSTTGVFVAVSKGASDDGEEPEGKVTSRLLRIDPESNEIEQRRTVDGDLANLVAVDDRLFGLESSTGDVVPIDPVTLETGEPIAVGASGCLCAVAAGGSLWVSVPESKEIVRVAPDTGEITGRVAFERTPTILAAGPAGLYAVTEGVEPSRNDPETRYLDRLDVVVRIDPVTASVVASSVETASVDQIVVDPTQVVVGDVANRVADLIDLTRLDPVTLSATLTREYDGEGLGLLIGAPNGVWGTTSDELDGLQVVTLDSDLSIVSTGIEVAGGINGPASGLDAIWFFDGGLRAVYRISTG